MRTIVITAGHSNTDPGAVNGAHTEAAIVTEFRNLVAAELTAHGVAHVVDGTGSENKPLAQAIRLITPGALAVEFHCNAFTNKTATGTETLSSIDMQPFGARLCEVISNALGIKNRGAKDEGSGQHSRLGFVRAGGLICELFFLSNERDLAQYLSNKQTLARAVAGVILNEAAT